MKSTAKALETGTSDRVSAVTICRTARIFPKSLPHLTSGQMIKLKWRILTRGIDQWSQ
jgi:hypothetical protein